MKQEEAKEAFDSELLGHFRIESNYLIQNQL